MTKSLNMTSSKAHVSIETRPQRSPPLSRPYELPPDVQLCIMGWSESLKAASVVSALIFAGGTALLSVSLPRLSSSDPSTMPMSANISSLDATATPTGPFVHPTLVTIFASLGYASLQTNLVACVVAWFMIDILSTLPTNARVMSEAYETSVPYLVRALELDEEGGDEAAGKQVNQGGKNARTAGLNSKFHIPPPNSGGIAQQREYVESAVELHSSWLTSSKSKTKFLVRMGVPLRWVPLERLWRVSSALGVSMMGAQMLVLAWIIGGTAIGVCACTLAGICTIALVLSSIQEK